MSARRKEKAVSLLSRLIPEFIKKFSFGKTIVTVTRLEVSDDLRTVKVFIGAYPQADEARTMALLAKKNKEIRKYIGSHIRWKFLPELIFLIDEGEKNRQRIEELLAKS
ncbi:MAG: 30S ribosome-binding factor RbfA [bacterium]|nr:30S ribosome-binding factor RbfA [bacterium]